MVVLCDLNRRDQHLGSYLVRDVFAWGREEHREKNYKRHLGRDKPRDGHCDPIGNIPRLCRVLKVTLFEFVAELV